MKRETWMSHLELKLNRQGAKAEGSTLRLRALAVKPYSRHSLPHKEHRIRKHQFPILPKAAEQNIICKIGDGSLAIILYSK